MMKFVNYFGLTFEVPAIAKYVAVESNSNGCHLYWYENKPELHKDEFGVEWFYTGKSRRIQEICCSELPDAPENLLMELKYDYTTAVQFISFKAVILDQGKIVEFDKLTLDKNVSMRLNQETKTLEFFTE